MAILIAFLAGLPVGAAAAAYAEHHFKYSLYDTVVGFFNKVVGFFKHAS